MEKPFINFESEIAIANPQSRPSVCPRGKQDVLPRQGQSLNRRAAPAILLFAPWNSGNVRGIRGFRGVRASPEGAVAASVRRPYPPALSGAGEGSLLHRDRSGSALWLVRHRPGSLVFISLFPRLAPRDRRVFVGGSFPVAPPFRRAPAEPDRHPDGGDRRRLHLLDDSLLGRI